MIPTDINNTVASAGPEWARVGLRGFMKDAGELSQTL